MSFHVTGQAKTCNNPLAVSRQIFGLDEKKMAVIMEYNIWSNILSLFYLLHQLVYSLDRQLNCNLTHLFGVRQDVTMKVMQ